MFNSFVERLSTFLGLKESLKAHKKGEYLITLEPNLEILLRENLPTGITLFSTLGALPQTGVADFLLLVMGANLYGKETGNTILGCDREGKMLTLLAFVSGEASYNDFLEALEEFANYADYWQQECVAITSKQ